MRVLAFSLVAFLTLALPASGQERAVGRQNRSEAQRAGRRLAFLVGINDYLTMPKLRYCRQDVQAIRRLLIEQGRFEAGDIVMLIDGDSKRQEPTLGQIYTRLPQVLELAGKDDLVFVYFAGHGAQFVDRDSKAGYFVPVDGSTRQTAIPLSWITEQLEACKAGAKVLVLDACRNDVVDARATRSLEDAVVSDAQGDSFVTLFSCAPGQRSSEHSTVGNGVFTHYLLEGLRGQADADGDKQVNLYEAHQYARRKTQQWGLQRGTPQSPILKGEIADPILLTWAERLASPPPPPPPPDPNPSQYTNSVGMRMVRIPAGDFRMGSPASEEGRDEDEHQHRVRISRDFYLAAHEVTVGQFRRFVEATGYRTDAEKGTSDVQEGKPGAHGFNAETGQWGFGAAYSWRSPGYPQADNHPVVCVSWNDAEAFCRWLSEREGRPYRLPTEAEWEYACRAGSSSRYWWGADDDRSGRVANVADKAAKRKFPGWTAMEMDDGHVFTAPVGTYRANSFGLHDMSGNVWEWCRDWYGADYYKASPNADPAGPGSGSDRVLRGGSWYDSPRDCRSALRGWSTPGARGFNVGFRISSGTP